MNRLNQLLKRMALSLCLPLFSVFGYASYAQEATFIDNVLTLSKATVGETAYALELGLSVNQGNYDFGILAAAEVPFTNTDGASIFDGSVLRVPTVDVGGTNYSLDLTLISGDPITFRLSDYAEVAAPTPSALAQATTLFGDSIETQIVQAKCTVCHKVGLIASNSGLLFVSASESSAATNLGAFANYLSGSEAARTRILSMVTGVGHTGGKQMEVGSDLHQNLGEMLRLLLEHQAEI
ncbi:hypothetical protein N9I87_03705 [Gammaproteobacteria bacterium]|nr:hypothetical protein [Gammaproteobacteria bacterium]